MVFSLLPFLGLLTCAGVHVLVSRTMSAVSRLYGVAISVAAGLGLVAGVGVSFIWSQTGRLSTADLWGAAFAWVVAYVGLAGFYVFGLYNAGESARRIRLLREIHEAGARGLNTDEILRAYNARMIVEARLQRLVAGRQVIEREGRYFVHTPVMLRLAKLLVCGKWLLFGAGSEFAATGPRASRERRLRVGPS